jgi:DNA-binding GntR family transcriptional regulator
VFERIRDAIWAGDLPPGMPLREAHLAAQLNVSQVPVREALLQLEHLGLVLRVPDRGTTVTKLTLDEIRNMLEVRQHLEKLAFQRAVSRLTPAVIDELKSHLERMEALVRAKDHFGVAEEDFAFHRTVWRASGNDVLAATLERLCTALYAFVSLKRHAAGETMKSAVASHTKLLRALKTGDEERAMAVIGEHLSSRDVVPESVEP